MEARITGLAAREAVPEMRCAATPAEFLAEQVADPDAQWSLGTFGAIAEFSRDPLESMQLNRHSAITSRGALALVLPDALRLVAFETVTKDSWSSRVALCLPRDQSAMSRRSVLTELGPDNAALRPEDRDAILFDVGVSAWQTDVCIRVHDRALVARFREVCGTTTFAPGSAAGRLILETSPDRVLISRVGRIEVYQPIPPAHGKSPEGPHTHVLPDLLRRRRTHAATEPIPADLIPCAHLYPPHPAKDAMGYPRPFDARRQARFDAVLRAFGEPKFTALKEQIRAAVIEGRDPQDVPMNGRFSRTTIRVALRQMREAKEGWPALSTWLSVHDAAATSRQDEDERHIHHR
ncbi:MAG: hypothetical protein AB7O43_04445 [Hyphomicrobiaceae bacterium]